MALEPRNTILLPRIIAISGIVSLLLVISACGPLRAPPASESRSTVPTAKTPPPADPAQLTINRLLGEARSAFEANQLTTPLDNNAYFLYLQVLAIDEDHLDALQGLNDIVERYLEWAIESATFNRFRDATHYLNSARSIDEAHPNISAVENLIDDLRHASRERFPVPADELDARSNDLAGSLMTIGRTAVAKQAKVTIIARDDEEGRWIYQQMNAASETRVRARVELGAPPEVRLRY
ncbi:MAG: hypothetical protein WD002_15545 [Pseudomonadales bacterium]